MNICCVNLLFCSWSCQRFSYCQNLYQMGYIFPISKMDENHPLWYRTCILILKLISNKQVKLTDVSVSLCHVLSNSNFALASWPLVFGLCMDGICGQTVVDMSKSCVDPQRFIVIASHGHHGVKITGNSTVMLTICWHHRTMTDPHWWALVGGIHRWHMDFLHKGPIINAESIFMSWRHHMAMIYRDKMN